MATKALCLALHTIEEECRPSDPRAERMPTWSLFTSKPRRSRAKAQGVWSDAPRAKRAGHVARLPGTHRRERLTTPAVGRKLCPARRLHTFRGPRFARQRLRMAMSCPRRIGARLHQIPPKTRVSGSQIADVDADGCRTVDENKLKKPTRDRMASLSCQRDSRVRAACSHLFRAYT